MDAWHRFCFSKKKGRGGTVGRLHYFLFLGCLVSCLFSARDCYAEDEEGVSSARMIINVPSRTLYLYDGGQLVYKFPVAVGTPVYKTPLGPRELTQIIWNPWWIPPDSEWAKNDKPTPPGARNPLGPVKMELGNAIRLHGTNRESTVGTVASHGCMRMFNENAKTLAWWIQSHFSNKNDPALLETYRQKANTSFYVQLKTAIPVEIQYDLFEVENKMFRAHPDIYGRFAGRLKDMAYAWLEEHGFYPHQVSEKILEHVLKAAKGVSAEVALKELLPAKLSKSMKRLSDPYEEGWIKRKDEKDTVVSYSEYP